MSVDFRSLVRHIPIIGPVARQFRDWTILKSPIAPFVATRRMRNVDALHDFWRGASPEGNEPERYLKPTERSQAFLELIDDVPSSARILEIGCNVGRNLAHLYRASYRNIEGVEISEHAVGMLRKSYPELAECTIHIGAAENVLPRLESESFDLVFTMAVIVHIHPGSAEVFDDIARIAKSRIVCIEPSQGQSSWRHFPHDVEALFTRRGFRLRSKAPFPATRGYASFIFSR